MAAPSKRAASEALNACLRIQRAHVDFVSGIRCAIVVLIVLVIGYRLNRIDQGLALAIGVLFACIPDYADSFPRRARAMAWSTVWCAVSTLIAGLVSSYPIVHVVVGFAMAAACGYAMALGPRAALIGVLTLVLFAVFGGSKIGVDSAVLNTIFVLVGGGAYILITLAIWPLHRLGSARLSIARAYREFAQATTHTGIDVVAPTIGAEVITARSTLEHIGVQGATADWAYGLVNDLERARLAAIGLHGIRDRDPAYVDALTRSSGHASRLIGDSIVVTRPGDVTAALQALDSQVAAAPSEQLRVLADDVAQPLHDAAARLVKPWPIGRRADISPPRTPRVPVMPRLRAHLHLSDGVFEHAVRLMIAFGVALIFATATGFDHAYWVPMTVAWITKPDLSGTVTRVLMRILGTLTGIVASALVILAIFWTPIEGDLLAFGVAFAAFLAIAYIWANYPVAVTGITMFVLLFEHLAGEADASDFVSRVLFTVLAGIWVLLISLARPRRAGATALDAMERLVREIRAYAVSVKDGGDVLKAHADVLRERSAAVAAIAAAAAEPRGLFERPGPDVDPGEAAVLLTEAIDATALIVTEELLGEQGKADPALWSRVDADLSDIDARISDMRVARQPAG